MNNKSNLDCIGLPEDLVRYRTLTRLAADWVWELDAELRYCFHGNAPRSLLDLQNDDLIGRNRIELLSEHFVANESLAEHHQCLVLRKPIDLILAISISPGSGVQYVNVVAEPQFDDDGRFTGYLGCERDVTQSVKLESELTHLASHDDLTGVMNRRAFERELSVQLRHVQTDNESYSLCFIDLDRFKQVNDEAGHQAGDQLLRELVGVIQKHLLPEDTLARIGGDEFGLLIKLNASDAVTIIDKVIDAIAAYQFTWKEKTFRVGASVGIAPITKDTVSTQSLMLEADNACYSAKSNGRNQSVLSSEKITPPTEAIESKRSIYSSAAIRSALDNRQFKLLVQPIVSNLKTEDFKRYEILLRLQCENGELLEPGTFMPVAIGYGMQHEIDFWVVANALQALEDSISQSNEIAFTINLSAGTLASVDALDKLAAIFSQYDIPKNRVCIDITESTAIRNLDAVFNFMDKLKSIGVEFALDDFGNSLSSLTYLHRLPINYLKFDGELIRRLSSDETVRSITASIAELGRKLGIETIAESVEDSITAAYVQEMKIDFMQGFGVESLTSIDTLRTCPALWGQNNVIP